MFGLFRKKVKDVVSKLSKQAEEVHTEQAAEEKIDKITDEVKEKLPSEIQEPEQQLEPKIEDEIQPKKILGIFKNEKGIKSKLVEKITTTRISEEKFEELFWELEVVLLENNTAVDVIDKIKSDLKAGIVEKNFPRGKIEEIIRTTLNSSISELFTDKKIDLLDKIKEKKPYVIVFVGINGSGKTTTIAKVASYLKSNGNKVVLAAADTFRAAAINQLSEHADKLQIKVIKQDYGADPAAVAYDAVKYAQAKGMDVVLIDTAGRLHSNKNLVEEMKKIVRVAKPDMKIFVGESITGNDCTEQAKQFNEAVGIDAIVLAKADIDEKGGAAISVSYVTKKPILFLGTGQQYSDLEPFSREKLMQTLGLEANV